MMKKRVEMAHLRQTCSLGLPSRVVMPHILEDVHEIVMSDRTHFAWSDSSDQTFEGCYDDTGTALVDVFRHRQDHVQIEFVSSYQPPALVLKATRKLRSPSGRRELNACDQRLFRKPGLDHSLSGFVRSRDGLLGLINLHRPIGDPDFSAEDEENLTQTLPYIAHAICHEIKAPDSYVDSGDAGLMVFDVSGELKYQSVVARQLCPYLMSETFIDGWRKELTPLEMQREQRALFNRVVHVLTAHQLVRKPPAWTVSNKWGEFHVQVYAMQSSQDLAMTYGVMLKKKIPIEVWLLQRVKQMPLSAKQSEICYLLARGVDTADIATQLCITQTTLKDHTQAIYRKLGIRKREELRRLVLS